jgi:nucleoside phosphorylase
MTDIAFTDPCLLFALRREYRGLRHDFPPHERVRSAPVRASFCGPAWLSILVVETGIGEASMQQALDWLVQKPALGGVPYVPKLVISAGFSGALVDDLRVGDIIVASEVRGSDGTTWPVTWPGELTGTWQPPLHRGRLLGVNRVIADAAEKRALGRQHDAVAADMETAVVARMCSQHGLRFGCVRAISDDAGTCLSPHLAAAMVNGRISLCRLFLRLLRHPKLAAELWRLDRNTRHAAARLGTALGELLTLTLPWNACQITERPTQP